MSDDDNAFVHERVEDVDVLRVFGDVDVSSTGRFETAMRAAARIGARLVVDLRTCTFIDSSILTALIRAEKTFKGRFGIILPEDGPVRRIFAITSLLKYLPVVADLSVTAS